MTIIDDRNRQEIEDIRHAEYLSNDQDSEQYSILEINRQDKRTHNRHTLVQRKQAQSLAGLSQSLKDW